MTRHGKKFVSALVADAKGEFFDLPGYAAAAMAGTTLTPLAVEETINMPPGGEHLFLPDRRPILFDISTGKFEVLHENPFSPGEPVFPVAAFNAPGYTITGVCAFAEEPEAKPLPLFSYGAVGWLGGRFRVAALQVDSERRQDLRLMPPEKVAQGVSMLRRAMPGNRLREHLETCALTYGCPAGKNFFLGRFEAPLPTSTICNARCLGCLSLQRDSGISSTQERMTFTPAPEEIAQVALYHINRTKRAVVSFGQGCEGEPLMAADAIEPAIREIRKKTPAGTINLNTNVSLPAVLERLLDAGLDSIRVSMNSVRKPCYEAYFRPKGYKFEDVLRSIELAGRKGKFVSINYLNMPGFTDTEEELSAFMAFLRTYPVSMIQWRNLNFDPLRYWKAMGVAQRQAAPVGMPRLLAQVRRAFPNVKFGYFNPPREKW